MPDKLNLITFLYRAGYTPNDYFGEVEWSARRMLEQSLAIKCPNIAYHLAGTKKVNVYEISIIIYM